MFFIQATGRVSEHFKCQVFNDVLDALGGNRRRVGTSHRNIEQTKELPQRGLVHNVNVGHLDNQEI